MIESLVLACLAFPFITRAIQSDHQDHQRRQRERNRPRPGLSSQRSQIKPLTPAQIKLGKKAYLGPRKRK